MNSSTSSSEKEGLRRRSGKKTQPRRSPSAPPKLFVLPPWTQDLQSLQIETKNLLRKCGTNAKPSRLKQPLQSKVARETKERPNSSLNLSLPVLPRPTSADSSILEGDGKKKIIDHESHSAILNYAFDDNTPTRPRQQYTDPHVFTQTRRIARGLDSVVDYEKERHGLRQMKILSDLTVEEQSEEEIERFRRRSLINREEYSARKIQRYFRLKLGSEKSLFATNYSTNSSKLRSDSELRKLGRSAREQPRNSYYSANPRRRARFKNLSLNVSVNAGVNDCLPSRDAAADNNKEMISDTYDCRSSLITVKGRLFLEDGAPSDYLESRILQICKEGRPKSAPNEGGDDILSEITSQKESAPVAYGFEASMDEFKLPALNGKVNRIFSPVRLNNKAGHSLLRPKSGKIASQMGSKISSNEQQGIEAKPYQRCISSSQNHRTISYGGEAELDLEEHELIMKLESDGIVLCKNGEPGPLCRRFRSEVFQESFLQESSTFSIPESERKLFRSALQQSHPIYRMMAVKLDECNIRHRARRRVKYWIRSFIELFHYGKVKQQQKSGVSLFLRSKVTQSNQRKLLVLSKQSQLLRCNAVTTEAYDFDMAEPLSKPVALYQPREYLPSEIREFFLTDTGEVNSDVSQNSSSKTESEAETTFEAERSSTSDRQIDGIQIALHATIRQRPAPKNMAVGGLSTEIIFSNFVNTCTALYGGYKCKEHLPLLPEPSPNIADEHFTCGAEIGNVSRVSVERGFDSPIDKYLPLPIIIYSGLSPEEKYRIKNRPRLSNIKDFFGFRTSEAAPPPILNSELKTHPVLPCPSILCPSSPRVEKSRTTHSDLSYPFCQPQGRVLTTKDYQHLLHRVEPSPNKTRTYISFCSRRQGIYLKKSDAFASLGRTVSKTYCKWIIEKECLDEFQDEVERERFYDVKMVKESENLEEKYCAHEGARVGIQLRVEKAIDCKIDGLQLKDEKAVDCKIDEKPLVDVACHPFEKAHPHEASSQTNELVDSITKALSGVLKDVTNTSDMLRVGVGLGMSLGAQGLLVQGNPLWLSQNFIETEGRNVCLLPSLTSANESGQTSSLEISLGKPSTYENGTLLQHKATEQKIEAIHSDGEKQLSLAEVKLSDDAQISENPILPKMQASETNFFSTSVACNSGSNTSGQSDPNTSATLLSAVSSARVARKMSCLRNGLPSLPDGKSIGRVKPGPAGVDWAIAGYNPWCSLDLLPNVEFESSYSDLEASLPDATTTEIKMAEEFAEVASFVKQGKYEEIEERLGSRDWILPADYANADGNTILMISCQYGNKRLAKLLLKKGSEVNKQNINGHTCLHYAFGYGFDDLGNYLISKGADDKILNAERLTCYEGFHMDEVDAL